MSNYRALISNCAEKCSKTLPISHLKVIGGWGEGESFTKAAQSMHKACTKHAQSHSQNAFTNACTKHSPRPSQSTHKAFTKHSQSTHKAFTKAFTKHS